MKNAAAQREIYDTSPRNGCCLATNGALGELARNAAARHFPLTVVARRALEVPVWEPVDFLGDQAAPPSPLSNENLGRV